MRASSVPFQAFLEEAEEKENPFLAYKPMLLDTELNSSIKKLDGCQILDYGEDAPQHFPFDSYAAYRMRLICFVNAAIYAIRHDNSPLEKKLEKILKIKSLLKAKLEKLAEFKDRMSGQAVTFKSELYLFHRELCKKSGLTGKDLELAESFFVWQKTERPARRTRYRRQVCDANGEVKGSFTIEQCDRPRLSNLTGAQKAELRRIHDKRNQPRWFRDLPAWAQTALINLVPQNLEDLEGWEKYQKSRPALLRQLPGEANAATHEFKIDWAQPAQAQEEEEIAPFSTSVKRQSVPSSFNMKNKAERQQSAIENLKQMLDDHPSPTDARDNFRRLWGLREENGENKEEAKLDCPILLGGLITPAEQAGWLSRILDFSKPNGAENNTEFARDKELAFDHYRQSANGNIPGLRFFNLNVPLNSFLSVPVAPDNEFRVFVQDFLNQQKNGNAGEHKEADATAGEKSIRTHLIGCANEILKAFPEPQKDRNRNLYLAAIYDVTTRLMGGESTGNCKSTKDRKAVELIMADAMLIYAFEQIILGLEPRLPLYQDSGTERKRFVEIFCQLYASGHQLLLAHDNSPGAPGIKDEYVLDKDVIQKLQSMRKKSFAAGAVSDEKEETVFSEKDPRGVYVQSKEIAGGNKPGAFWRKYSGKICKWGMIISVTLCVLVSAALIASGVLSPLGLLVGALTTKLGFIAATLIGAAATVTIAATGTAVAVALACAVGDGVQTRRENKTTFVAQMKRAPIQGGSSADISQELELSRLGLQQENEEKENGHSSANQSSTPYKKITVSPQISPLSSPRRYGEFFEAHGENEVSFDTSKADAALNKKPSPLVSPS